MKYHMGGACPSHNLTSFAGIILDSPLLEVVQVYGMDPEEFVDRIAK